MNTRHSRSELAQANTASPRSSGEDMELQGDTSGVFSKMTWFLSSGLRDGYKFTRKARAEEKLINISKATGDAPSEAPAV